MIGSITSPRRSGGLHGKLLVPLIPPSVISRLHLKYFTRNTIRNGHKSLYKPRITYRSSLEMTVIDLQNFSKAPGDCQCKPFDTVHGLLKCYRRSKGPLVSSMAAERSSPQCEYDIVAYPKCPVSSSIFKISRLLSHSDKSSLQHTRVIPFDISSVQAISQP